jgi:hypothetical protein
MVGGQESERKGREGGGGREWGEEREREVRERLEELLAELVDLGAYAHGCSRVLTCADVC